VTPPRPAMPTTRGGLVATEALSPARPITIHLTGSYETTAAGVHQWWASWPGGGPAPEAIRDLDPSTPISVCYLSGATYSGIDPSHTATFATEVLAILPDGSQTMFVDWPGNLPVGPPS